MISHKTATGRALRQIERILDSVSPGLWQRRHAHWLIDELNDLEAKVLQIAGPKMQATGDSNATELQEAGGEGVAGAAGHSECDLSSPIKQISQSEVTPELWEEMRVALQTVRGWRAGTISFFPMREAGPPKQNPQSVPQADQQDSPRMVNVLAESDKILAAQQTSGGTSGRAFWQGLYDKGVITNPDEIPEEPAPVLKEEAQCSTDYEQPKSLFSEALKDRPITVVMEKEVAPEDRKSLGDAIVDGTFDFPKSGFPTDLPRWPAEGEVTIIGNVPNPTLMAVSLGDGRRVSLLKRFKQEYGRGRKYKVKLSTRGTLGNPIYEESA